MTTFQDLLTQVADYKYKRSVLLHLIEHIDSNFRPVAGQPPLKVLLTDEKVKVPPQVFESIVVDVLLFEVQGLEQDIANIEATALVAPEPAVPAPVQPGVPAQQPIVEQPQQPQPTALAAPPPPPLPSEPPADTDQRRRRNA